MKNENMQINVDAVKGIDKVNFYAHAIYNDELSTYVMDVRGFYDCKTGEIKEEMPKVSMSLNNNPEMIEHFRRNVSEAIKIDMEKHK